MLPQPAERCILFAHQDFRYQGKFFSTNCGKCLCMLIDFPSRLRKYYGCLAKLGNPSDTIITWNCLPDESAHTFSIANHRGWCGEPMILVSCSISWGDSCVPSPPSLRPHYPFFDPLNRHESDPRIRGFPRFLFQVEKKINYENQSIRSCK